MRKSTRNQEDQEPMGIIISRGMTEERPPFFQAYVWGPPDLEAEQAESKAA
jgi:hypothetical protein